jgi:hypothetical protein
MKKQLICASVLACISVSSLSCDIIESQESLHRLYIHYCQTPSDINEHVPVLKSLAKECNSVIEMGVRSMVSSWGILQGLSENPSSLRSYLGIDINRPSIESFELAKRLAQDCGIAFDFWQANNMTIDIESTDLLFIDTYHTYLHLTYELEKFSPKVNKYIAMHDTSWPYGDMDEGPCGNDSIYPQEFDRTKRGLWNAVVDFLERHPEWTLYERRFNNHGFTILKRKQ